MIATRIVQAILFAGVGWGAVMAVRIFVEDHRRQRVGPIRIDYSGEVRRKMDKIK